MLDFIIAHETELIYAVLSFFIIFFSVKKDKRYLVNILGDIKDMLYKTERTVSKPQSFEGDNYQPVYRLNEVSGELEKTDEVIDIQELIDSCKKDALNFVLDRFLNDSYVDEIFETRNEYQDDLDMLTEIFQRADYYRDKFNMPADSQFSEIFQRVNDELTKLKNINIKNIKNIKGDEKTNEENKTD